MEKSNTSAAIAVLFIRSSRLSIRISHVSISCRFDSYLKYLFTVCYFSFKFKGGFFYYWGLLIIKYFIDFNSKFNIYLCESPNIATSSDLRFMTQFEVSSHCSRNRVTANINENNNILTQNNGNTINCFKKSFV